VAADGGAPPDAQRIATLTLIGALIGEGQLDTAAARLQDARYRLGADDRAALGAALARARIRRGELTLADSVLANDSSVQALALHGWIALYRGDLHEARARFRAAGPYAGERREATERTAMLALIERIPRDSFPALGRALLTLARGDSAVAVTELRRAAEELTPEQGRGDALLLAGRICARLGAQGEATAVVLFAEVVRVGGKGSAPPAAELAWAELLIQQKQLVPAITHLENVILNYPESAVVPEARRRLDAVKGATPKS
jgi:tetratricopeptide (TPR) repeat protein